jgi:hypothetical protein
MQSCRFKIWRSVARLLSECGSKSVVIICPCLSRIDKDDEKADEETLLSLLRGLGGCSAVVTVLVVDFGFLLNANLVLGTNCSRLSARRLLISLRRCQGAEQT